MLTFSRRNRREAMITTTNFPALVRLLRQSKGLTQEEFVRELDVTLGTLNGCENGRHRPVRAQQKRLLQMAQSIGVAAAQVPTPEPGRIP
jgi:DNA-binding transcriptional regulator YiaG